jgi:hypothetical protein
MLNILSRRALRTGRLARLGATPDFHHGLLRSGYLIGEQHVQGKAAAGDVQLREGHVILLGFRPEWRAQSFGTFKVLFNALLFGR